MTLPAGGVIQYTWPYPASCSDQEGVSGAILWNGGFQGTIYRRLLERDEYANGLTGGLTGKTIFSHSSPVDGLDPNHPGRSGGFVTQADAYFDDAAGHELPRETHSFYGDPAQPASVPADPTMYPAWSDGLEFQTQISQNGVELQLQKKLLQQQPCADCWFDPASDTSAKMNGPVLCQTDTTLDGAVTSGLLRFYNLVDNIANNLTEQYEYDFGVAPPFGQTCPPTAPANWFRPTYYSYWFHGNPKYAPPMASALDNANLIALPSSKEVHGTDGSGSVDYFSYDETALQPVAGAPGHDDTNFSAAIRRAVV